MGEIYKNIFKVLLLSLVLPLMLGYLGQVWVQGAWVNVALHATLEAASAAIALVMAIAIYQVLDKGLGKPEYISVVFAFLAMGILDVFHAMMAPSNLFVWYHALSVLVGGWFFAAVWLVNRQNALAVSRQVLLLLVGVLLLVSVLSLQYQASLPVMLTASGEFSSLALWLNALGGMGFVLGGIYYLHCYVAHQRFEDLVLLGAGMLFGSAGILFVVSNLWNFEWYIWHGLRALAFILIVAAFYQFLQRNLRHNSLAQKKLEAEKKALLNNHHLLQQYQSLVDETSIVSKSDIYGRITYVNDKLLALTGYQREELLGKSHNIFKTDVTPQVVFDELWQTISRGKLWQGQLVNRKKNGEKFHVQMSVLPIKDAHGVPLEFIAVRHDITQWKTDQDALTAMLTTDELTGLHNRTQLIQELEAAQVTSLALLNIDSFKEINDFLGVQQGDDVIRQVAKFLTEHKPKSLRLFRVHGDEFALIESLNQPVADFQALVAQLVRYVGNHHFMIQDQDVLVSVTAGISMADTKLLAKADMALRVAKKNHKAVVNYADLSIITDQFKENLIWSRELKSAINEGRILAVYQPIYSLLQEKVVSYECLVRLKMAHELVSPYYFLEIAKKTRLYADLTRTMLMFAFETFKDRPERFAVNLSAEDLATPETLEYLQTLCTTYDAGQRLTIEITESEGIENFEEAVHFLNCIKVLGVKVAIDDYGTGYSNFEYLMRLQPDYIKFDGSLIRDILHNADKKLIVETIVSFAKKRQIETIAEFVEDDATFRKLKTLGVDMVQGYLISPPIPQLLPIEEK